MDASSDPFRLRLRAATAGLTPHLRPHLPDYDRLRSHIKRIVFYQQAEGSAASSAPSTSPSHLTVPEQSSGRRSSSQPASSAAEGERAKRHHELFWSELKRQVEVVNNAYSREEKDCRKLIAQLAAGGPDVAAACRLITAHCSSAAASAPIRAPSGSSRPVLSAFNELLALCASLSSLSHLLFLSYLVLWRTISKYNRHTGSNVDQRLLAAFPSSPFLPPPRLASVLTNANQLFSALPSSSSPPSCPLCLNPAAVSVRLSCHTACFHCSVRQPGFGVCCPVCKKEEEAEADSLQLGDWVQRVGRLRVERPPEPQRRTEAGTKRERDEGQQEAAALQAKAEKQRRLMVKISEANELAVAVSVTPSPSFPTLPFPSSPLSARSYSSASSHVSSASSLSLPLGPPVLPPSPGPNASPAAASAFDAFFASHYRPKRGQGVSCHQCKTNKEPSTLLFCANREEKGVRRRRCRKKYCESCLRRSYPLDVLVREEGRDWHCPSCVGVCCCAACQRKETGSPAAGASVGSGEAGAAKLDDNSPQLSSLGSDNESLKAAAAGDRSATTARAADNSQQQSASQSLYRSRGQLSSSSVSGSPSLSFFGHPLPHLEPLSSPMTPDSVTLPLPLASPVFRGSEAPSVDDWQQQQQQQLSSLQQTAAVSRKQSFTASQLQHPPGIRSLLPPNSLLAAINSAPASASSSQLYSLHYGGQEPAGDREGSAAVQAFFTAAEEETGQRSGSLSLPHQRPRSGRPSLSVSTSSSRPQMAESGSSSYGYSGAVQGEAEDGAASRRGSRSAGPQSRHHRGSSFSGSLFASQPPSSLFFSQQAPPAFQSTCPLPSAAAASFRSAHSQAASLDFSSYALPSVGSFLSLPSLTSSPTGGLSAQFAYPELSSAASSLSSVFPEPAADYSALLQHHADYAAKPGMDSDPVMANMDDLFAP